MTTLEEPLGRAARAARAEPFDARAVVAELLRRFPPPEPTPEQIRRVHAMIDAQLATRLSGRNG